MSKFTLYSLLIIAAGLLVLGFQGLQSIMGMEVVWKDITIEGQLKPEHIEWVQGISWSFVKKGANFLMTTPLYQILLAVGGFCLILSGILGRR